MKVLAAAMVDGTGVALALLGMDPHFEGTDLPHWWRFPSVLVLLLAGGIGLVACFCLGAIPAAGPSGAERLSGAVSSGDAEWESGALPAVAGTWRARFVLERATGSLRVRSRVR